MSKFKENKENNNLGCIVLVIFFCFSWGVPSLIRGDGFFYGIKENILAIISLGILGLLIYGFYKLFLEK
jgi:hypothetical protein